MLIYIITSIPLPTPRNAAAGAVSSGKKTTPVSPAQTASQKNSSVTEIFLSLALSITLLAANTTKTSTIICIVVIILHQKPPEQHLQAQFYALCPFLAFGNGIVIIYYSYGDLFVFKSVPHYLPEKFRGVLHPVCCELYLFRCLS